MVPMKHSDQRLTKTPRSATTNSLKAKFGFSAVKEKGEGSGKNGLISPLKKKSIKYKMNDMKGKQEVKRSGQISPRKAIPKLDLDITPKSAHSQDKKIQRKSSEKKVTKAQVKTIGLRPPKGMSKSAISSTKSSAQTPKKGQSSLNLKKNPSFSKTLEDDSKDNSELLTLRKSYNGPNLLQRARNDSLKKKQNNLRASYNSAIGKKVESMLPNSPRKDNNFEPAQLPSPRKPVQIKYYSEPKSQISKLANLQEARLKKQAQREQLLKKPQLQRPIKASSVTPHNSQEQSSETRNLESIPEQPSMEKKSIDPPNVDQYYSNRPKRPSLFKRMSLEKKNEEQQDQKQDSYNTQEASSPLLPPPRIQVPYVPKKLPSLNLPLLREDFRAFEEEDKEETPDLDLTNLEISFQPDENLPENLLNDFSEESSLSDCGKKPFEEESKRVPHSLTARSHRYEDIVQKEEEEEEEEEEPEEDERGISQIIDEVFPLNTSVDETGDFELTSAKLPQHSTIRGSNFHNLEEKKKSQAALKVQRVWHGFRARKAFLILKKEKQAEDMYRRLCTKNTGRIFNLIKEKCELIRKLKSIFSEAKLRALIRLQRLFRKKSKQKKERRQREKMIALICGWRVRKTMKLPDIASIIRGVRDLRNLIQEMSKEHQKKHQPFLEKMKKDLPLRVKEFNQAYAKAYKERRYETTGQELKKQELHQKIAYRKSMRSKKSKYNLSKHSPLRHNTVASKSRGPQRRQEVSIDQKMVSMDGSKGIQFQEYHSLTFERRESYLSNLNAALDQQDIDSPILKPKKKKGHHRATSNYELSQLAVAVKADEKESQAQEQPIQSILSSRSSKDLILQLKEEGTFKNSLFNIFRDIEKVFSLAKRGKMKARCDEELKIIFSKLQGEYDTLWDQSNHLNF